LRSEPKKYFYPPYVGVSGWIGIELNEVSDEELAAHVVDAWKMMEAKQKKRTRARQR
jgi:phage pi2 protein 07